MDSAAAAGGLSASLRRWETAEPHQPAAGDFCNGFYEPVASMKDRSMTIRGGSAVPPRHGSHICVKPTSVAVA